MIPELLKRAVEIGVEKASHSPETLKQFVHDLKLPKEMASYLLTQIDDTKNGLFRVVAKEMRDFLEHTNFSGEVQKLLTTVQFEINTTVRFSPNESPKPESERDKKKSAAADPAQAASSEAKSEHATSKPEIKMDMYVKREERPRERRRRGNE